MKAIKPIFTESVDFIKRNKIKTILAVVAMVLSYGFYITSYTLNIDDVFTDFWNGGRLVAAGRFTGYLVQLVTGFMTYSPFFTILLAMSIFFVAGLVFSIILYLASEKKLSDNSVFVFWIVFLTYPIISEQMVYPIIVLLAVGYLFTALSLYLVDNFFKTKSWSSLIVSVILMILYIDFYEAFATVYLTFMVAVLLVKFIYGTDKKEKKFSSLLLWMIKLVVVLGIAVIVRMLISKVFLYVFYGTTQSGYSGNADVYWFELGAFDGAIWLIRTVFLKYFWAAVDYLPIFIFVLCIVIGMIITLVMSIKKKTAIPVLAFLLMIAASLSLNIILGLATNYTMSQALVILVAFTVMLLFSISEKKKAPKIIVSIFIVLLILNQAKSLNVWSVANFERYDYESGVVDDIGQKLVADYPVESKTVIFIGGDKAPHLPKALVNKHESNHPLVKLYQKAVIKISDAVIPNRFFTSMSGFYGKETKNADELFNYIKTTRNSSSSSLSYLSWAISYESWFDPYEYRGISNNLYDWFENRGYTLKRCTKEDYEAYMNDYNKFPAYPKNGYINETDKYIIVNFGE